MSARASHFDVAAGLRRSTAKRADGQTRGLCRQECLAQMSAWLIRVLGSRAASRRRRSSTSSDRLAPFVRCGPGFTPMAVSNGQAGVAASKRAGEEERAPAFPSGKEDSEDRRQNTGIRRQTERALTTDHKERRPRGGHAGARGRSLTEWTQLFFSYSASITSSSAAAGWPSPVGNASAPAALCS